MIIRLLLSCFSSIVTTAALIGFVFAPKLAADNLTIPALYDYPFGIVSLRVDESVTLRASVKVSSNSSVPVDIMLLINDSEDMGPVVNTLSAEWGYHKAELFPRWDTRVGIARYNVSSTLVIQDLTFAKDSTFQTQVFSYYIWVNNTKVAIYEPVYEFDGDGSPAFGIEAIRHAIDFQPWRNEAHRVLFALMDSNFKEGRNPSLDTKDFVLNYLGASGIVFSGLEKPATCCGGIDPELFANVSGGSIASVADQPSLANEFSTALAATLDTLSPPDYTAVSINDEDVPSAGVDTDVACVSSAPGGSCATDTADGTFDRQQANYFEFDVTFTPQEVGNWPVQLDITVDGKVTGQTVVLFHVDPPQVIFKHGFEATSGAGATGSD